MLANGRGGVLRIFLSTELHIKAGPPTARSISPLAAAKRRIAFTLGGRDNGRARVSNGRRPCVLRCYIRLWTFERAHPGLPCQQNKVPGIPVDGCRSCHVDTCQPRDPVSTSLAHPLMAACLQRLCAVTRGWRHTRDSLPRLCRARCASRRTPCLTRAR